MNSLLSRRHASSLHVWLNDVLIGRLTERRGALTFTYDPEVAKNFVGTPLLSVSMPARKEPYEGSLVDAFFRGLLPEGEALKILAYDFDRSNNDTFGLLCELGREVAGALQILLPEEDPTDDTSINAPLSETEIADKLRALRFHPLGVDQKIRVSLAGVQEKLLLSRHNNRWYLPSKSRPSTHILKPETRFLGESVANEYFCMQLAHIAGVETARTKEAVFNKQKVLVVERFDRADQGSTRLHQEDFCQAYGLPPHHKYEENSGPSLVACSQILRDWGSQGDLLKLLDVVVVNMVIGNADAHGKNFALLHHKNNAITLAPAYDLLSTRFYHQVDTTLGMFINQVRRIDEVRVEDIANEAASWGIKKGVATEHINDLILRLEKSIGAATVSSTPSDLARLIKARIKRLRA